MDYPYDYEDDYSDYEDEYADYDKEAQFQKIKKKNHKTQKPINQKTQIRQSRKEKNKDKENAQHNINSLMKEILVSQEEEYDDDWE